MNYNEFANKIKAKHPQYTDMDNRELAQKMVTKFKGQYDDVTFDETKPLWSPEGSGWEGQYGMKPTTTAPMQPTDESIADTGITSNYQVPTGEAKVKPTWGQSVNEIPANVQKYIGRPMAETLARVENIPNVVTGQYPLSWEGVNKQTEDVNAKYNEILTKPNFVESLLTDPTILVPGVPEAKALATGGKLLKTARYMRTPVANALVQTGAESVRTGDYDPTNMAINAGAGTLVGAGTKGVGNYLEKALPEGAIKSLGKKLGLKPKNQSYPQGTDVGMLFTDNQIPLTGGREGIYNRLQSTVKNVGDERDAILGGMRNKYEDMLQSHNKDLALHEATYPELSDEQAGAVMDLALIRKGKTPPHIITAEDYDTAESLAQPFNEWVSKTPIEPSNDFTLAPAGKLYENAMRVYNEATTGRALTADEKAKILATIKKEVIDFEDPTTGRATLEDLIKRRGQWADKGKVGTKAYDELSTAQAKAYALLSQAGSATLNSIPDVAEQNKKFARYLPTLNAMEEKIPSWNNQTGERLDITKPATWASAPYNSNLGLVERYNAGRYAQPVMDVARRFAIPTVTTQPSDRYQR